jgi:hypothetical protein
MSTRRIQFTVSATEYEQLHALADERGCTVSGLVREAVRAAYLKPLRLQSQLAALDSLLAPFGALAEDDDAASRLREDLDTSPAFSSPVPPDLDALRVSLGGDGMFAGLGAVMDSLDDLRAQWEAEPGSTDEDGAS